VQEKANVSFVIEIAGRSDGQAPKRIKRLAEQPLFAPWDFPSIASPQRADDIVGRR